METSRPLAPSPLRQTLIGLSLTAAVMGTWATIHIAGVFFVELSWPMAWAVVPLVLIQMWLSTGLFIISHDAIHGSLAPGRPKVNRSIGWLATTLYAGFNYDVLEEAHHRHHRHVGTAEDPDFCAHHPTDPVKWFWQFFKGYFGWRPLIFVNTVVAIYWLILGAPMLNIFLFYGLPALASAGQLFYFGTYLPHRHGASAFHDHHNARTTNVGWVASLLSCYHFGYHHEHHLFPQEPWWRLPARRLYGRPAP